MPSLTLKLHFSANRKAQFESGDNNETNSEEEDQGGV